MENIKFKNYEESENNKNDYELKNTNIKIIKKRKYLSSNYNKIIEERTNDEDFKSYCKYALLKYANEKRIDSIAGVLESMYYHRIDQGDLIKFCYDLFDGTYSIEKQVDKILRMYEENYMVGFQPYII